MRSFLSYSRPISGLLVLPAGFTLVVACSGGSGDVLSSFPTSDPSLDGSSDGTTTCNGPGFAACLCTVGETRACYTGPANTRGVGRCKDGIQTCRSESQWSVVPCEGEVVPTPDQSCTDDGGSADAAPDQEAGAICGGIAGFLCPDGQYCTDFPVDDACGGADSLGTCKPKPGDCTADCPGVCGCDGNTYCNTCGAAHSGTSVRHAGPCS